MYRFGVEKKRFASKRIQNNHPKTDGKPETDDSTLLPRLPQNLSSRLLPLHPRRLDQPGDDGGHVDHQLTIEEMVIATFLNPEGLHPASGVFAVFPNLCGQLVEVIPTGRSRNRPLTDNSMGKQRQVVFDGGIGPLVQGQVSLRRRCLGTDAGVHQYLPPRSSDGLFRLGVLVQKPFGIIAFHGFPAGGLAEPVHLRGLESGINHAVGLGHAQFHPDFLQLHDRIAATVADQPTSPARSEGPTNPEVVFTALGLTVSSQEPDLLHRPDIAEVVVGFSLENVVVAGDQPTVGVPRLAQGLRDEGEHSLDVPVRPHGIHGSQELLDH